MEVPASTTLAFPQGFLWGTATSSHQVEGGNENNDWWAWEQVPGRIHDGSRCGLASDWWHRAEEDLAVAAQLGQNAHRLSLEWSRLEPSDGAWHEPSVIRYRQILSHMRSLGIKPMVTLFHFTLPLWVYERGGWESDYAVRRFARYVARVVDTFGDLCNLWCTINEPMLYAVYGYVFGVWPPGSGGLRAAGMAFRNMARAHAQAYELIHARQAGALVGFAKHLRLFDPMDPRRPFDRIAAHVLDYLFNDTTLAAFVDGTFLLPLGAHLRPGPAKLADYIGVNYYSRDMVQFDPRYRDEFGMHRFANPGSEISMAGWGEVYPAGLYRALRRLASFGLPIYVTEFGVPDNDDSKRPRFIITHVAAMRRAIEEGVPLRGAYFWSLVDNFEWAEGWGARFGLLSLDPASQARTLKPSALVYRRIAQANGLERSLVQEVAPDLVPALFDGHSRSAYNGSIMSR
jgi:beta-glucosidase